MEKKSLAAAGIRLSVLTLASRILGLVREMTKASLLGTSALADAFGVAFLIPNLFRRLFAENSISVAFIPTFRAYIEGITDKNGREEAQHFLSSVCTVVSLLTTTAVVAGIIACPFIVPLFMGSSPGQALDETVLLTRIMFPYLGIISFAALLQGILNALKLFSPSGFTPILFNLTVIICSYLLSGPTGNPARAMSVGVVLGGIIQVVFQLPFVLHTGWRISFTGIRTAFRNKGTQRVFRLIGPTIVGMAAYQLNDAVSTALAGHAGTGVVSSLQYSLRLQELILGIFAVSIGTVILPDLSGLAKRGLWSEFSAMLFKASQIIILITVPVSFFSFAQGEHIIVLVYKSRSFDSNSVMMTLEAFRFHIAGLLFIALNRVFAPAFYAQGNTRQPTLAGIGGFAVNILLAVILVSPMGGGGIALALTIASAVNTLLLIFFLSQNQSIQMGQTLIRLAIYTVKIALFSAAALIPTLMLSSLLTRLLSGHGRIISEGIPVCASALLFSVIGVCLLILSKDSVTAGIAAKIRMKRK